MSKELEALEKIVDTYYIDNMDKEISIIEAALNDYELMKQPKIIVADKKISDDDLEKLKNQRMFLCSSGESKVELLFDEETQKKLKALEIIKKKQVNVRYLFQCKSLRDYNFIYKGTNQSELCLTKEEYDILKEVLL